MPEQTDLEEYRAAKDEFFRTDVGSPIPPDERDSFTGLPYYPPRDDLAFELHPVPFEQVETVVLETSDGAQREFERWARLSFEIDGQPAALALFRDPDHGDLFLAFQDETSGRDTYGAGRYLEVPVLETTEDGEPLRVLLDFNYAHHPFCAYNPHYSCPLPPSENRLSVSIEAGERNP
ncbi:MAG: DUF1684 domain-containing protein [Dehalococcoidia bacterium]|nr:DUF1684 domain-containing protein [Dehalococcoidia bacterium]